MPQSFQTPECLQKTLQLRYCHTAADANVISADVMCKISSRDSRHTILVPWCVCSANVRSQDTNCIPALKEQYLHFWNNEPYARSPRSYTIQETPYRCVDVSHITRIVSTVSFDESIPLSRFHIRTPGDIGRPCTYRRATTYGACTDVQKTVKNTNLSSRRIYRCL